MDREPSVGVPSKLDPEDYYFEGPLMVFTAAHHLKRGSCCGSGCRHCPYGNGQRDRGRSTEEAVPNRQRTD
jgi:hypothetical protein